ncbi:MAG: ribosome recycling factor [Erysipelotrichaceae bacterium]
MSNTDLKIIEENMQRVIEHLLHELNHIRTGRANPKMLEDIQMDYYGTPTPLSQIAQISVVEGTQLVIKAFDPSSYKDMERAIGESHLGLPVVNDGSVLRINLPKLTEDRRKEIVKEVHKIGEDNKVKIRNIRRDANDAIKKSSDFSEDAEKAQLEDVQKLTDSFTKQIDELIKEKSEEVTKI